MKAVRLVPTRRVGAGPYTLRDDFESAPRAERIRVEAVNTSDVIEVAPVQTEEEAQPIASSSSEPLAASAFSVPAPLEPAPRETVTDVPYSLDHPYIEISALKDNAMPRADGAPGSVSKDARFGPDWMAAYIQNLKKKWGSVYYQFLVLLAGKTRLPIEQTANSAIIDSRIPNAIAETDGQLLERLKNILTTERYNQLTSDATGGGINASTIDVLRTLFPAPTGETNIDWSSAIEHTGTAFVNPVLVAGIESAFSDLNKENGRELDLSILMTGKRIRAQFAELVARNVAKTAMLGGMRQSTVTTVQLNLRHYRNGLIELGNLREEGNDYVIGTAPFLPSKSRYTYQSVNSIVSSRMNF